MVMHANILLFLTFVNVNLIVFDGSPLFQMRHCYAIANADEIMKAWVYSAFSALRSDRWVGMIRYVLEAPSRRCRTCLQVAKSCARKGEDGRMDDAPNSRCNM